MRYGQSFNTGAVSMGMDDGVVHVKHREFLGVINSSTEFTTQQYELNPGLDNLMPWCSSIANNFQQYKIQSMAFEFVSTSATALSTGTNNALGQISIATQYDSLQQDFRNLNDMLNSQWATSTKISSDLLHPIEAERDQTTAIPLYVRSGRAPGDIRLYDWGKTTLGVYGCQSTGDQIGQIWVSYDICFYKPITFNLDGGNAESAFYSCYSLDPARVIGASRPLGDLSFGDVDTIGLTFNQTIGATTITMPRGCSGYYFLNVSYFGTSTIQTPTAGNLTFSNAVLQTNFFGQSPINDTPRPVAGSSTPSSLALNPSFSWIISVTDPNVPNVISFVDGSWGVANVASTVRGVVNVALFQLNVDFSQFQRPSAVGVSSDACCEDLQAQIDRLTILVQQLQEQEEESEAESEEEHKDEERRERRQDVEIKKLSLRVDECCPKSPRDEHAAQVEDKQKRVDELKRLLEEALAL
jgi:Viral coat protein (S domain).